MSEKQRFEPQELSTLKAWHAGVQKAIQSENEANALYKTRIFATRDATNAFDEALAAILMAKGFEATKLTYINLDSGEFTIGDDEH